MTDRFIVAEVSKNWVRDEPFAPEMGLISQQFEWVINRNHQRGYRLYSFSLHRIQLSDDELNETVIAVFEKETLP